MALQGWRLFGVSATIVIYITGVLFLSINNVPGSHPKVSRSDRFSEFSGFHGPHFAIPNKNKMTIKWCTELKYLPSNLLDDTRTDPSIDQEAVKNKNNEQSLTALASFPGSGNTWLRYLLQQSTGIFTGSIYKDYGLLKTGFPAENVCNASVLIVKTHEWGPKAWSQFSKVVLLVRDPEKAILAEFNRQSGGHIGFASPDRYKRTKGKYWQQFVANKLKGWELLNLSWGRNFTGQIQIVFYEDLVTELEQTLRQILRFLRFPIDEKILKCALARKEGIFRRRKRILNFDPFTPLMRAQIREKKEYVYRLLGRYS